MLESRNLANFFFFSKFDEFRFCSQTSFVDVDVPFFFPQNGENSLPKKKTAANAFK
jgi:hypothetical protein